MIPYILIGAGGHSATIVEIAAHHGLKPHAYVDPSPSLWAASLGATRMDEDDLPHAFKHTPHAIIGFVGLLTERLERRLALMERYRNYGAEFPSIIHPSAIVSPSATIEAGVHVLPGAIINAQATLGEGAVINSGAIIEHHAYVGRGCHIAPRASVLGHAKVGATSFIGAGAVVIQNQQVPAGQFVRANSIYPPPVK